MDQESLVKEQIDAGSRFLHEFNTQAPVTCAAWLKEVDSGRWYLYVILDAVTESNIDIAYSHVLQITGKMAKPKLDPFRVRVIGANTAAAADVLEIQRRRATGTTPAPWPQPVRLGVEAAHFYDFPAGAITP